MSQTAHSLALTYIMLILESSPMAQFCSLCTVILNTGPFVWAPCTCRTYNLWFGYHLQIFLAAKNICPSLSVDPPSLLECGNWLSGFHKLLWESFCKVSRFCASSLRPVWPSLSLGRKLRRKEELPIFLPVYTLAVSTHHLYLRLRHRPCGSTWVSQQEHVFVCECIGVHMYL